VNEQTKIQRDRNKFFFITFGCQMNKLDSELAAAELLRAGFAPAESESEAGVIIVNTCSVRRHAEERALSNLGRFKAAKNSFKELVVVVMGCMAQKQGEAMLDAVPPLDIVCGTRKFAELPSLLARVSERGERIVATEDEHIDIDRLATARPDKWRAFICVLRGCNSFCSYCIVPYVRGRETSRPPADIVAEAKRLAEDGCVEITLLGQNIDAYEYEGVDLAELLRRVAPTPGLRRLRFITSHPKDISPRLLDAIAEIPQVCEHLHMPAQSGSDNILAAMNRGYTAERYLEIVQDARRRVPNIEIASDFIVGFPGETDADFEATVSLMRECQFNQSFIFKYSPREGTRAERMQDDVPQSVKENRNHVLLAVQEEISRERQNAKIGRTFEIMVEGQSKRDKSKLVGRTRGNDIVVFTPAAAHTFTPGEIVNVEITDSTPLTLFGRNKT